MNTVSPTIHRFALTATRAGDQGAKAVATCFSASGSGENGTGGVADFSGTCFFVAWEGSASSITGSALPITSSLAGGEVPLLLSRVPLVAEPVPLPGSHEIASASPVPVLAGKFRPHFHRFRRCRGGRIGGGAGVFQPGTLGNLIPAAGSPSITPNSSNDEPRTVN
jgi:hypothetical protein